MYTASIYAFSRVKWGQTISDAGSHLPDPAFIKFDALGGIFKWSPHTEPNLHILILYPINSMG